DCGICQIRVPVRRLEQSETISVLSAMLRHSTNKSVGLAQGHMDIHISAIPRPGLRRAFVISALTLSVIAGMGVAAWHSRATKADDYVPVAWIIGSGTLADHVHSVLLAAGVESGSAGSK